MHAKHTCHQVFHHYRDSQEILNKLPTVNLIHAKACTCYMVDSSGHVRLVTLDCTLSIPCYTLGDFKIPRMTFHHCYYLSCPFKRNSLQLTVHPSTGAVLRRTPALPFQFPKHVTPSVVLSVCTLDWVGYL